MKIFLDCGAHDGGSVKLFQARTPDWRNWEIHCFEPNAVFTRGLLEIADVVHEKAVWIEDGERPFYLHRNGKLKASSLISSKDDLALLSPLTVWCIDLGAWVKANCRRDDWIVLKMDIEGAEYWVLPHMIADRSIDYVNVLYAEFHYHKVGIAADIHQQLLSDLQWRGLEPKSFYA